MRYFLFLVFLPFTALDHVPLTCEGGLQDLPEHFFVEFDSWQQRYGRNSLKVSRDFLYSIFEYKVSPHLQEALEKCPLPVLEIMLNAILAISIDNSLEEASAFYQTIMRLAHEGQQREPLIFEQMKEWTIDTAHTYPFLFGMEQRGCYGYEGRLRVYVYDTPQNLTTHTLHCVGGMWGTEVLFHKYFLHSTCRTHDPSEADFFYVPIYGTCLFVWYNISNDKEASAALWDPLMDFLNDQPWFARNNGLDHIFLFADGQSSRIWDSYDLIRSEAILLMVEAKCPTWDEPMRRYIDVKSCYSPWKDVVIPGHTDHARIQYMRKHNLPVDERDIIMTWHGRHPGNHKAYGDCSVRGSVVALEEFEGVDVGGFVPDYLERKGRSRFCLVPGGTSPWTNHLYESFFCGCIPVILSDEYTVAFQEQLDWSKFSIKWPEADVGPALYEHLRSFSLEHLKEMKHELDRHACWFDYFSDSEDCSPFLGALQVLDRRKRTFPGYRGKFWNALINESGPLPRRKTRFHSGSSEQFSWLEGPGELHQQ